MQISHTKLLLRMIPDDISLPYLTAVATQVSLPQGDSVTLLSLTATAKQIEL